MSDTFPNGVTTEQLEKLLKEKMKEQGITPLSDVIPILDFGGKNGGFRDLTTVVHQINEKSRNKTSAMQHIDLALWCLERVYASIETNANVVDLPPELLDELGGEITEAEKKVVASQMKRFKQNTAAVISKVVELYTRMQTATMVSRLDSIRKELRKADPHHRMSDKEVFSYLLYSDELLDSLKLDRKDLPGLDQI